MFFFIVFPFSGHWIATGQFWGKFKRKNATKNLEIKGGGTGGTPPPPLKIKVVGERI